MTLSLPNELELNNPFWNFSVDLWENESLRSVLLKLQNDHQYRINLLFFACWLGIEKKLLAEHIVEVMQATESWHLKILAPLRDVRMALPKQLPDPALKQQLQTGELMAEKVEHALLFQKAQAIPVSTTNQNTLQILVDNLLSCATFGRNEADTISRTDLIIIIQACLPAQSDSRVNACLENRSPS